MVERKHRHILERIRAIRFQGNILIKFWGLCVQVALYIINRIPSHVINDKTPFTQLPTLSDLRVLGFVFC